MCSSVSLAISLGRSAAPKPTSSKAWSRSPGSVSGIVAMAARSRSATSAAFLANGRRCARLMPANVVETTATAVGGG